MLGYTLYPIRSDGNTLDQNYKGNIGYSRTRTDQRRRVRRRENARRFRAMRSHASDFEGGGDPQSPPPPLRGTPSDGPQIL